MTKIEEIYKHIHFPTYQDKALASMLYLATVFEKHFENKLIPFGITIQQFRILRILRGFGPKGIAIYKLPHFLPDRKSDVSRILVRMENAGWVKRKQDKKDKRMTYASINANGIRLLDKIDTSEGLMSLEIKSMTELQAEQLYNLLQILVDEFHTTDSASKTLSESVSQTQAN